MEFEYMQMLAKKDAQAAGRKEGLEEGRKEGLEEGRKEGLEEGRKEGFKEARKEAQEKRIKDFASLVQDGILSISEAASRSGLCEDQLLEWIQQHQR